MAELYPVKEEVKVKDCEPPSNEMGWELCAVDLGGLRDYVDLIFEVGGEYKPYEQQLAYAGVRNPSGEIERISIRKESKKEDRKKVAYIISQSELSFHLTQSDAKDWLDKQFPMQYGVGLLVVQRNKDYHFETDKCLVKVHLDKNELEKRGFENIEVVLGWKNKPVRDFPSFNMRGGDKGHFGGGITK
jgi:hypothetical protein